MSEDRFCYEVKIYKATNLPKCDVGGKCDLYCILRLPGGTKPYPRTRVYKKDYDPVLGETLYETGANGDVVIELWDEDRASDDFIGTVTIKAEDFPVYRKEVPVNLDSGMKPHREGPCTLTFSAGRLFSFETMTKYMPNAIVNVDNTVNPSANEVFVPFESVFVGFRYEKILSCASKEHAQPAEGVHFSICQTTTKESEGSDTLSCPLFSFNSKARVAYSYFISAMPLLAGKAPVLRRVAKNPIYYEIRAPNFTFTPLKLLEVNSVNLKHVFSKRISEIFKIHGVTDDSYKVSPEAYSGEKVKIEATSQQEGENVAVGVAPLFYLRIKRDAANNLEMWIDDTNADKYIFDVMYLSSSTDRKVRCRFENAPLGTINSHKRFTLADNVPRLAIDKIEISASVVKSKKTIPLTEIFPCLK